MSSQTVRLTIHVAPVTVVTEADDTRLRNMAGNIERRPHKLAVTPK